MNNFQDLENEEGGISKHVKRQTMGYILGLKTFFSVMDLFLVKAGNAFGHTIMPGAREKSRPKDEE